ncbi:MAG: murein transglycosylase A [Sphaerospermopsis sp. SIO1G2]|nr:murein transglycosylase A [Sphaerospermopsis sp. SIO1G1]NET72352.1 murein transglycosylase A [Sphaerospermopsis sp. SIO1G2]
MKKTLALFSLSLGIAFVNPDSSVVAQVTIPQPVTIPVPQTEPTTPEVVPALQPINPKAACNRKRCIGWDEQLWGRRGDRKALLTSIDHSLRYLETNTAKEIYAKYPIPEITLDRVRRSLLRFRQILVSSRSAKELRAAVHREFVFYQSIGNDGKGTVKFTAYYSPVYEASRVRTSVYKYPLYQVPPDFKEWEKPHPKRVELEGKDGLLGKKSKLSGLEMLWFSDRFTPYMIHIQGSATIKLTNGKTTSVGFAGGTDYPWTSIGRELAKDGKLPLSGLTMPKLISYFRNNPKEMNNYLPRWERFVFFRETNNAAPRGSINVPVTAERSIATDKSLMPPGALALINNSFPFPAGRGRLRNRRVDRFVLDQDTGSAIKGPGRVDYFMGVGKLAGDRAGITGGRGSLYYLLLKE